MLKVRVMVKLCYLNLSVSRDGALDGPRSRKSRLLKTQKKGELVSRILQCFIRYFFYFLAGKFSVARILMEEL